MFRISWPEKDITSDITPEMLFETRSLAGKIGLANVQPTFALAERLPFTDGTLDVVSCRLAAHHFADAPAFCREAACLCNWP